ncbi:hypothetical protein BCR44DRAFT_78633 [Catenaria anguillulae PL171]|uniref:Uncharacterized protein n=1 Tax=Catenaria anguillulae PL171 TaxID=765915 RepID=A0A1Y2HTM9_9FUNG|nr:hypothetical protein BCR44DRAFT_78633 [Catenaria anguillulae PL171]
MTGTTGTSINRTLQEIRDPTIYGLTIFSFLLAITMVVTAMYQLWMRKTKFYVAAVVLTLPQFIENAVYLSSYHGVAHTNLYLVVRMYSPILTMAMLSSLSIVRFRFLTAHRQLKFFTNHIYHGFLGFIGLLTLVTISVIAASYIEQASDPYFTAHPYRRLMPMVFMTLATITDIAFSFLGFGFLWKARAKILARSNPSDPNRSGMVSSSPSAGKATNGSTDELSTVSAAGQQATGGGARVEPSSSSLQQPQVSKSNMELSSPAKKSSNKAGLKQAMSELLVAMAVMFISLFGGMITFGVSAGNMLGDTISGLFLRLYLLPAIISWTLLVRITQATKL